MNTKYSRISFFIALIAMCASSQSTFALEAPDCLKITEKGSRLIWENVCEEEISIAYCSPTKPIWGKKCGDGGKTNVFYTHMTNMKAGEKSDKSINDKDYRVAPCHGRLNNWDIQDTFWSTADGAYGCTDPANANEKVGVLTSSGPTMKEACQQAQSLVKQPQQASECTCQSRGKAHKVHVCYVMSIGATTPPSLISRAKQKIIELTACKPQEKECSPAQAVSMGVRDGTSN